jgi:hypothetical protein
MVSQPWIRVRFNYVFNLPPNPDPIFLLEIRFVTRGTLETKKYGIFQTWRNICLSITANISQIIKKSGKTWNMLHTSSLYVAPSWFLQATLRGGNSFSHKKLNPNHDRLQ